jgi:hypothetical protein
MPKQVLTLTALRDVFLETDMKAAPHRRPNFKHIMAMVDGNPEVKGQFWFVETHNTGYDGVLERWSFTVPSKDNVPMTFWADLLPGKISTGSGPVIAAV